MKTHTNPKKDKRTVIDAPSRLELVKQGATNPHFSVPETGQKYVDVDNIVPDPRNERKNLRDMDELAASIKAVGLIEPPTVTPLGNGQYKLLTGERRWRAAKAAGLKRIHVIVGTPEAENRRRLKSLISNIQRADLGPIELAQALRTLKEEHPEIQTNRDLSRLIGRSEVWTSHMLNILQIPEHLQRELAQAKGISSEAAQQIARIQNPEAQSQLVQEALAGAATQTLRHRAKQLSGKPIRQNVLRLQTTEATVTIRHRKPSPIREDYQKAIREALTGLQNHADVHSCGQKVDVNNP